jgi:hypothetical protein
VGGINKLDYKRHVNELQKDALPVACVIAKYEDGAKLHLPCKEYGDTSCWLQVQRGKPVVATTFPVFFICINAKPPFQLL